MRGFRWHRLVWIVALSCAGQLGCTAESTDEGAREEEESVAESSEAVTNLTAGEIAGVLASLNQADILLGQLAKRRAMAPTVQAFAAQMVTDHTEANKAVADYLAAAHLAAKGSALSQGISSRAQYEATVLQGVSARAFDLAYMNIQILEHRRALQLLDTSLIPSAQGDPILPLLRGARSMVVAHLNQATSVVSHLRPRYPVLFP